MREAQGRKPEKGISIVIPHRDCEFLAESVSSVIRQRLRRRYEIIVVDDCSQRSESTRELNRIAGWGNVRVIGNSAHQGVQAVRNQGIANSRYGYILPLDADDMLREPEPGKPSFLARAARMMDADESVCFVHTGSWMTGDAAGPTIGSYPVTPEKVAKKFHVPINILLRRTDLTAGVIYDESIKKWQDWSFAIEILASRWRRGVPSRIGFVPGNHHLYRIHGNKERISRSDADEYEMTLRTVKRNYDYFSECYALAVPAGELARIVLESKPTKLTDLLLMARFDLPQALQLVRYRNAELVTALDALGIP